MGLAEIEARVAKREWDEALDLALGEWKRTRAPAYANLIDAISSKISRAPIPTASGYYDEYRTRWPFRARSRFAVDIPVLLEGFGIDLVPLESRADFDATRAGARVRKALERESASLGSTEQGPFMAIASRLEILAGFEPDPRVAKGLVRFIELAPIACEGALAVATYGPIFDFIAAVGDVRVIPALEPLKPSAARERALKELRDLVVVPLANEAEVRTLAKDLGFTEAAGTLDVSELLALVVVDLEDDTPRAILGDMWLEAGDPRGEFVQLQLRASRGALSLAEEDRMGSLEAQSSVDWLGEIALLTSSRRFFRGFLDEITLAADGVVPRERWVVTFNDEPRLGTVRAIRHGAASESLYRALVFAPGLRNLESIEVPWRPMLRHVVESRTRPRRLRRIELATALVGLDTSREEVESVVAGGLGVTLTFERVRSIIEYAPLLALAKVDCPVVLRGIDAEFVATRSAEGQALAITSRDAVLVEAALRACPDAVATVSRPRGAKLHGPNLDTRRFKHWLGAHEDRPVTFDTAWTELLRR